MTFSKSRLVLIKIGGSSITNKQIPYSLKRKALKRFAKEIAKSKKTNLLISHGAGSFAHTSASKYGGKKGYVSKIGVAKVFADAAKINSIVTEALIEEGVPVISLIPNNNEDMISASKEVEARGAHTIVISNIEGKGEIIVPKCDDAEFAIYAGIIGHLMSYYVGVVLGVSIDRPKNLAKCVSVR